jgi:hypothetical protein
MANKKISELDTASALDGTELLELVQSGVNVKAALADLQSVRVMALIDAFNLPAQADDFTVDIIRVPFDVNDYAAADAMKLEATVQFTPGSASDGTAVLTITASPTEVSATLGNLTPLYPYVFKFEIYVRQTPFGSKTTLHYVGSDNAVSPTVQEITSSNFNIGDSLDGSDLVITARVQTPDTLGDTSLDMIGGTLVRYREI